MTSYGRSEKWTMLDRLKLDRGNQLEREEEYCLKSA